MQSRSLLTHIVILLAATSAVAQDKPATPASRPTGLARWEKEIAAYESQDREPTPEKGGLLFTGASSIRRWKSLPKEFPGLNVVDRGFGGSQVADATHFADRVIFPYEPKRVLLRAGGKDLHAGKTVDQVFADFTAFVDKVRARLPDADVVRISQSPAPARRAERDAVKELNRRVADHVRGKPRLRYVETYDMVLAEAGEARKDLFLPDMFHFNDAGNHLTAGRLRPLLAGK